MIAYCHLKESLVKFVEAIQKNQADADKPLPKDDKDDTGLGSIKKIVDECHELRTSLSEELGYERTLDPKIKPKLVSISKTR